MSKVLDYFTIQTHI